MSQTLVAPASNRAELAAAKIAELVEVAEPGARLGTKQELRVACGVSVGTFNEALRLLQGRGLVAVRPGPGGGLFAAAQSPIVRLGNSVLALNADQTSVAEAVRIRDALDPLLVEDALANASPRQIKKMREHLAAMRKAAEEPDATAFVHANWALHGAICDVSPNHILASFYRSLLDMIESHTLDVLPVDEQPLPQYLQERFDLHKELVDAIEDHDATRAQHIIELHNLTTTVPAQD